MNTSKKIIFITAFMGILGLGGVARAMSTTESRNAAIMLSSHSSQVAQTSNQEREVNDSKEVPDSMNDSESEVNDDKVPVSLSQVGEYGETVYDMAKVSDWKKATANLTSLQNAAKNLPSEIAGKQTAQLNKSIVVLSEAVRTTNRQATMHDANQVTLIAAKMTNQFEPKVPVEVTLLDYYGRELEIWAATGNTAKLETTASEIQRTWNKVHPSINAHGGSTQAQKFNHLVTRIKAAKSPNDYGRLATPILDEVDNLEKVFK